VNQDLVFNIANQNAQLCSVIVAMDDEIVEALTSFSLQLMLGIDNDRISIEPSTLNVAVEDDDSM
jgi:hypothetical protein